MAAGAVTRWARRFVAAGGAFLLAWQAAALFGWPRQLRISLAVHGFVLHAVFGKAYSLVPSYFDRELATPRAPAVQFPLSVAGALGLAAGSLPSVPEAAGALGTGCWLAGVAVFVGALGWTLRDNPTGRETGTGDTDAHRRGVDRFANAFVPIVFAYLLAGSYGTAAPHVGLPAPAFPQTAHLLAAGTAALLVFAVGFRLLPRLLVADPPRALVAVVLPAGALGPALLAWGLYRESGLWAGAALQALAVLGFGLAYAALFARSERRRIGGYAVLAAVGCGALGVLLGLHFAAVGIAPDLVVAHFRLNVLGFLGLTIVGATYQFYPPSVGRVRWATDRTAGASILLLAGGLLGEAVGAVAASGRLAAAGRAGALAGALLFAGLIAAAFRRS
ncbi:hypothetical protein BRC82_02665 [Halobacteriales archaeon QS_1_67_19]|nr:MAG: hypothetical protein BRC82_02665 [Halobacteriales archaeon QS_1_67_19]